jgi:type III secretion system TyeA family effector delivery regulator
VPDTDTLESRGTVCESLAVLLLPEGSSMATFRSPSGQPIDALVLMKEVLPLRRQKWINIDKVLGLADMIGVKTDEQRIYFLRELHTIVRQLPESLFETPEDRLRLTTAVQEALDQAINQEAV